MKQPTTEESHLLSQLFSVARWWICQILRGLLLFTQYQNGDLDPETIIQFRNTTRALRESVMKRADVVVSTLFATGQHSLYSVARPTVIAVDECAKSFEIDPSPTFGFYCPTATILVGENVTYHSARSTVLWPFILQLNMHDPFVGKSN